MSPVQSLPVLYSKTSCYGINISSSSREELCMTSSMRITTFLDYNNASNHRYRNKTHIGSTSNNNRRTQTPSSNPATQAQE
jgi:hypothetical protein